MLWLKVLVVFFAAAAVSFSLRGFYLHHVTGSPSQIHSAAIFAINCGLLAAALRRADLRASER